MTERIGPPATRSQTTPLRGTRPLETASAPAVPLAKQGDGDQQRGLSGKERLEAMRDALESKVRDVLESKEDEKLQDKRMQQRFVRHSLDVQWRIFFESLERYLTNLAAMAKQEANVLDRRLQEGRSQAKYSERLLTAAAAQAPEHRVTLLSTQLSQKA